MRVLICSDNDHVDAVKIYVMKLKYMRVLIIICIDNDHVDAVEQSPMIEGDLGTKEKVHSHLRSCHQSMPLQKARVAICSSRQQVFRRRKHAAPSSYPRTGATSWFMSGQDSRGRVI